MEEGIRSRLEEHRRFGQGQGIILLVFAALSWSRHPGRSPYFLGACALSFVLSAWAPAAFAPLYAAWMPIAERLARFNLALILGAIYYGVLTPYAAFLRLRSVDLLEESFSDAKSYWKPHESDGTRGRHERMS